MTVEEAIETLNLLRVFDAPHLYEAVKMAVASLRAKQTPTKMDRSRWKGCFICKGETYLDGDICISGTHYVRLSQFNFCPDCGRPLTEEAWAELERRIGVVDGANEIDV